MDKLHVIDDIEIEYRKLYNECKKKYSATREGIEGSLKILANLKTMSINVIESELKNSLEILLKPIIHATETKHSKLFVSSLSIVKKFVTYNLIKQNHTGAIIQILKDILDNTSEEFIQIKVLETLLPMVNPQTIHLTETLVNNVLMMCLKIFSFKNAVFKNPVSALFKQLMITTYGFLDSFMRPVIEKKIKHRQDLITQMQEEKLNPIIKTIDMSENKSDIININVSENKNERSQELVKEIVDEIINESGSHINGINEDNEHEINLDDENENKNNSNEKEKEKEKEKDPHLKNEIIEINTSKGIIPDKNIEHENEKPIEEISSIILPSDIDVSEFTSFEVYQTSLTVFKSLIQICEGKKKEWIAPNTYSKCLALELLSGVICQSGNLFKYLPDFSDLIKNDLYKIIKKNFEITNDYIMGMKLARISIQIIENLNTSYDLIHHLLKYAETQALTWQKLVGLECLSSLFQNNFVLLDLYQKKFSTGTDKINIYDDIINTLSKVSYGAVTNKVSESAKKKDEKKNESIKHQKYIETSSILTETDTSIPIVSINHIFKLLTECYINYKESLVTILELHGLKLGHVNTEFNQNQLEAKDLLNYNFEVIKNSMTALLVNSGDDSTTQTFLNLYQNFINIYGSISLPLARDSYLNDLCKLAIPNNLENSMEMKDKNLLITKALFNIAHCVNILDYNSWLLLIETMQKIYQMLINSNNHMLKPSEEFEIDVIIKNLEGNIKKYNPDYEKEEKSVLKYQQGNDDRKSVLENDGVNVEPVDGSLSSREAGQPGSMREKTDENNININNEKKKGLFSMMKSALGFSKHNKQELSTQGSLHTLNQGKRLTSSSLLIEENVDLQILSNAIDTIFISSLAYDDNTIKDITRALLDSSKNLIEKNQNITENINTYLHFNLTKLLELSVINVKRIHIFWDIIVMLINFICSKNLMNISRFSLDVLTIIDLFIIIQYKPYDNTTHNDLKDWNYENWQMTLLIPFTKIATSFISQNINLNIIYNLSKILQNCGQCLNAGGWTSFIQVCETLIMKSDEIQCDNTFKLIEQIMNEYLDYLCPNNVSPLINILEMFSIYKKNHNISYSAITMFWSAAGVLEKFQRVSSFDSDSLYLNSTYKNFTTFQKEFYKENFLQVKEREEYFNTLWKDLFFKLVNICSDPRFDVRKSAINIFADIFVAKNPMISNEVALIIINKYFMVVLDKSYTIFEDKLKINRAKKNVTMDQGEQLKTPKFSDNVGEIKIGEFKIDQLKLPERKQKFDEDSINSLTLPSGEEKEWEETSILVIQALGKTIKSFLFTNFQKIKVMDYYKENLLSGLITLYIKIMRMTTPEISSSILKSLQEIYYANIELFLANFEYIWKVWVEMGRFITTDFFLSQLCTMATSSKMVYNVLEILKEIFLNDTNIIKKPDLIEGKNLENLLLYINNLIKSSKHSEGIQSITNPQRLLGDEKLIFEFVEKLSKVLVTYSSWDIYCKYLSNYIHYDTNDNHSEAHLRKSLELFDNFFSLSSHLDMVFVRDYLPKLIHEVKEIACLRNKNEVVSIVIKNNKSQMQLWHFATFGLIKILSSILCKNSNKSHKDDYKDYNSYISNYNSEVNNLNVDLTSDFDKENDKINLNNIWEATINCFETIFKQSEGGYKNITRNLLEELLKSCQEMEIQIINFIVNGLLPNSLKIPKEMQIKLLTLLDTGSNFDYNIFNLSTQSSSSSSNISRVCISNLFELCKFRSEESLRKEVNTNPDDYVKVKIKIAKMSTPILIKRCKETLKKFLDDEIKSGAMPLARSRLEDIKYVLEKLKNLEIHPNYTNFEEDPNFAMNDHITMMDLIIKNKKSFLFNLLPLLSDFITTKENDIKLIIKDIFKIISGEIGVNK